MTLHHRPALLAFLALVATAVPLVVSWARDAAAPRAASLAPGPKEWSDAIAELEARVDRAERLSVAAARLQNAWARALDQDPRPCEHPDQRTIGARLAPFAEQWRDAVQDARVQMDRVVAMRERVTVAPLLDEGQSQRVLTLSGRVTHQVRAWGEHREWHERHAGKLAACGEPIASPGLPDPTPWTPDGVGPVPVLVLATGTLCPAGVPGDGRVQLLEGDACWSAGPCDCRPDPMWPGAVLGPPPPTPLTASEVPPVAEQHPVVVPPIE